MINPGCYLETQPLQAISTAETAESNDYWTVRKLAEDVGSTMYLITINSYV